MISLYRWLTVMFQLAFCQVARSSFAII